MVLYERIKLLAKEYSISIADLQKELGFSKHAIFRWSKSNNPNVKSLEKVADFFGVSMDYLIGRTDYRAVVVVEKPTSPRAWKLAHKIETAGYSDEQIETIESLIEYAEEFNKGEDE